MLGPKIGMGPFVAQGGKFHKCDVKKIDNCPDSCCAIIPCRLCLHVTTYTDEFWGLATYRPDSDDWYGIVDDREFIAMWERDDYTGLCEFVVTLSGEEVFREPICETGYGGVRCEEPEGSVEVPYVGTLEWTVHETKPLPYVIDPATGCKINFCGTCECAPYSLCVTVTKPTAICKGHLDDITYPCDAPIWQGTVPCEPDDILITVELSRDPYTDECLISGTYGSQTLEPQVVGCNNISATWELPDYVTVSVTTEYCDCDEETGCTTGCCFPYDYLEEPDVPAGQAGNYAQIIKWEIDAPNCPEIDGLTGQFSPETTGPHDPLTECGFCLCYVNENGALPPILGTARFPNEDECQSTPCNVELCIGLQCNRAQPPDTPDRCCKQFRLIVVAKLVDISGGSPVDTQGECFEGEGIEGNPHFPGCNGPGEAVDSKELSPSFCQCEDPESYQEFVLIFDLGAIGFACRGQFNGGPCDGLPDCCLPNCSLENATLTVTRL